MKISLDQETVVEFSEIRKKILEYYIDSNELTNDLKRRLSWICNEIYQNSLKKMRQEWDQKLKNLGVKAIPLDDEEYAELVFAQSEYKDRNAQKKEEL